MLMSTTLRIIPGVEDLIYQKKWQIHIWEWQVMEDIYIIYLGNLAHSVVVLQLVHLCWIRSPKSGRACHLYQPLGMLRLLKCGGEGSM